MTEFPIGFSRREWSRVWTGWAAAFRFRPISAWATARFHLGDRWVLAPTLEAEIFTRGRQASKLSDTGLGYIDVTNEQKGGRGHRASLVLEKDHWAIGAWTHYWHIDDSDVQFAGVVGGIPRGGREPENYTREYGLELRYRF